MPTVSLPLPNRKALSTIQALKSPDGVNWSVVSHTLDSVKNEISVDIDTGDLVQLSTKLFAKQTKPSTDKPVYNAKAGLMDVFAMMDSRIDYGVLLSESLIGKVSTNTVSIARASVNKLSLLSSAMNARGFLWGDNLSVGVTSHSPLTLAAPNNNSPAVKVLPYQISNNGQGSIGYQANELTWDADATNWGDDSAIKVTADGSDTFVDLNGNTNLSVVHELAIPYTWTSNHARAGEQVEGVDL